MRLEVAGHRLAAGNLAAMVTVMQSWPAGRDELIGDPRLLRSSAFLCSPKPFNDEGEPDVS